MSKAKDIEVRLPGIVPREHTLQLTLTGRRRYPFKAMIVGDFFKVHSWTDAVAVRSALRSFYNRITGRRFTVRQRDCGEWVCRRIV